ncbi:MAG: type II secretion system minor pseudopilin GspI [Nevskia sp.]|nr:type II secretion system minor pseudopilin GspI [Nevskia sp.]
MRPRPAAPRARAGAGFTLLEVLVAVFVLALTMAAIISAAGNYAGSAGDLRDKTMALWVAHNRLTEIELQPVLPTIGSSNDDVTLGPIQWTWRVQVLETPDPKLRRVDIRVEKTGDRSHRTYAELSSFLTSIGRKNQ